MNDERLILNKSKQLERMLRDKGYSGRGLHELTSAAEPDISSSTIKACRIVASIRNKVVHDDDYILSEESLAAFLEAANIAIVEIKNNNTPSSGANHFTDQWEAKAASPNLSQVQVPAVTGKSSTKEKIGFAAACIAFASFWFWNEIKD